MAVGLEKLKVKPFTQDRIPNDYPGGKLPWQTYHTVRNALVQTCRRFGPTGSLGVVKIAWDVKDVYLMAMQDKNFWEHGDKNPMYYLLEDQYNNEQYCYIELYGDNPFNADWLIAITETLREFDGWGLGVNNIPDSYVLIYGKGLMVKGNLAKCKSAHQVVERASYLLKRGDKKWWQFWR
ncbi:MAG: hypothetical protein SFX18_07155 [Pirellulales bacterium]|nr:hypothetical protein [Pirellulales bacterium]